MKNISKDTIIKNLEAAVEKASEEIDYWKEQHADSIKINGRLHKKIVCLEKIINPSKSISVDNDYWTQTTFNDVEQKTK
tara:strand:+ start:82 stop:318 length:237 start_codon:yes stop_codon:yes gene_type:complete